MVARMLDQLSTTHALVDTKSTTSTSVKPIFFLTTTSTTMAAARTNTMIARAVCP